LLDSVGTPTLVLIHSFGFIFPPIPWSLSVLRIIFLPLEEHIPAALVAQALPLFNQRHKGRGAVGMRIMISLDWFFIWGGATVEPHARRRRGSIIFCPFQHRARLIPLLLRVLHDFSSCFRAGRFAPHFRFVPQPFPGPAHHSFTHPFLLDGFFLLWPGFLPHGGGEGEGGFSFTILLLDLWFSLFLCGLFIFQHLLTIISSTTLTSTTTITTISTISYNNNSFHQLQHYISTLTIISIQPRLQQHFNQFFNTIF